MGSSCSSGQAHKDKDSVSIESEGSPCYQGVNKKESGKENHASATAAGAASQSNAHSAATGANQVAKQSVSSSPPERRKEGPINRLIKSSGPSVISGDSMSLSSPTTATQSPRDLDRLGDFPVPPEISQLPENIQHLLAGRVAAVKPLTKAKKITIYVCAADAEDCQLEKGVLHTKVYPELRRHCLELGYELHITDLHWKTELEKKQDHEFPELCLGELNRQAETAYVIPVLFLSNSLGAPLLPKTVECQDFEMAVKCVEDGESRSLLQEWYGLDSHSQPPCYRLRAISTRIPDVQAKDVGLREQALLLWARVVDRILAVLSAVLPKDLRDTYLTTVVEQEVHNLVFMSRELANRCLWLCRVFTHIQSPTEAQGIKAEMGPRALEQKRRLEVLQNELKAQLSEKHILRLLVRWHEGGLDSVHPEHSQYLEEVCGRLLMQLRHVVDEIVEDDSSRSLERPALGSGSKFFRELMAHTCFCQKAAQCSVDCEGILGSLQRYLADEKKHPLVVEGPPGCGKTSLLARAAMSCQAWVGSAAVLVRFVGLTPESSTSEQILKGLVEQCGLWLTGKKTWVACQSMEHYGCLLESLLQQSALLHRPLVILLDGLDQVREYGTCSTHWLPSHLPDGVKLVVSLAEESRQLSQLRGRLEDDDCFLKIPPLQRSSAQELLVSSVMQYNHSVDSQIQDCVKDCLEQCTLPLYVKVLAWQTSCYSEQPQDLAPKSSLEEEITAMLHDMEQTLGSTRVSRMLSLMLATKNGLSDSEALDLLSDEEAFQWDGSTHLLWAPACLFWARLQRRLGPFLESGTFWRDRKVFREALKRHLGSPEQKRWASSRLATYFKGDLPVGEGRSLCLLRPHKRKLDELPFQVFQATGSIKEQFLFNWSWLYDKLCHSDVFQVLEDVWLESRDEPDLRSLRRLLELGGEALSFDGRQLYSQVVGRVRKEEGGRMGQLLALACCPPVPSLLPLSPCLHSLGAEDPIQELQARTTEVNRIYRLRGSARFVATLSTCGEEVGVWDVVSQRWVRLLRGVDHPLSLEATDGLSCCVILCGRELRIYDLDSGCLVTRLKGVMNQKMPYFGLHDPEHVVALSRNRMYVNLMRLDSGDCVATFKVGEDRFLDSLLVSENGKILVCGDETQKPFPLLVWDLTARKLLYDLRIPHHEFITRLAAITYEGHFVCCVAREVDEPGPNFIIVYDLQSGTLFKKWKPGVSTISIAISSQQGCVISGLEDARILVWDLVTGNCKWTLACHRAPVDTIRLDQAGARFLSCDSQGRDRSLCLWDLTSGCLLSVFTPDEPVTACELSTDGQAIVLGLRGHPGVATLLLRHQNSVDEVLEARPEEVYGRAENTCREFQLAAAQEPR